MKKCEQEGAPFREQRLRALGTLLAGAGAKQRSCENHVCIEYKKGEAGS